MLGIRHGGRAIQRDSVSAPAGREHGRDVLYWQRGSVWHLLPYPQTVDTDVRWPQPSRLSDNVWSNDLPSLSWTGDHPHQL